MSETIRRKKPLLAFALSFCLPGAGLAYLGKWKWAFMNLGAVILVGIFLALILPDSAAEKVVRFAGIGLSAGSGALAEQIARKMNAGSNEK